MQNMKCSNIFKIKVGSKLDIAFITAIIFLMAPPAYAQATVNHMHVLMDMRHGLSMLIPIAAAVMLAVLLLIYVLRIIAGATFARWAFSIIIAGAAFYISNILFYIH
ncbi:conjugal transfer protein [Bartonella sp. B17]